MNYRINRIIAVCGWILAGLLATQSAHAFCVYNEHDRGADFYTFGGPNFSKSVPTGGNACCPYKEKSCNKSKTKTGLVQMAASVITSSTNLGVGSMTKGFRCGGKMGGLKVNEGEGTGFWMQGGGWATMKKGPDGKPYVDVYDANNAHRATVSCNQY